MVNTNSVAFMNTLFVYYNVNKQVINLPVLFV
jgi:hypothetical protein